METVTHSLFFTMAEISTTSNLIWQLLTDFTKQFYFMLESCGFGLLSTLNSEGPNSKKSVSGQ